jgi:hypothetical protein
MVTDNAAGVADGYGHRRVIVFDCKTGAYKRHWGAYGVKQPSDDQLPTYKPLAITELPKVVRQPRALRPPVARWPRLYVRPGQ